MKHKETKVKLKDKLIKANKKWFPNLNKWNKVQYNKFIIISNLYI